MLFSYSYAAVNNHLEPILNFVSDSGSYERSAGLFAQCLDLSAFFCKFTHFSISLMIINIHILVISFYLSMGTIQAIETLFTSENTENDYVQ